MKAKLIKIDCQFFLYNSEDDLIATTEQSPYQRLSLKNCQAIERGYDLDELAKQYGIDTTGSAYVFTERMDGFKAGFQKALELMGDKKFSEEDMRKAVSRARMCSVIDEYGSVRFHEGDVEIIQSLQQTEWDVIIEMGAYHDGNFINDGKTHIIEAKLRPILDSGGCLILKRK